MTTKELFPIIQWVGGKNRILNHIDKYIPKHYGSYHELFLGGGALLFKLRHHTCYINEINYSLINLYKIIIEDLENFISEISKLESNYNTLNVEDKKIMYNKVREEYNIIKNNNNNNLRLAILFIFLNRTCYNALYRENLKGGYNVPFGNGRNINFDIDNIRNVSMYLKNLNIYNNDFKENIKFIKKNDFVYLDPPYYNTFNSYHKTTWTNENSLEVLKIFKNLTDNEVAVILSNNNDEEYIKYINEILLEGTYKVIELNISRTLNCNIHERGKKKCEILIVNKYCNFN
jgi:DNA adenine methylase